MMWNDPLFQDRLRPGRTLWLHHIRIRQRLTGSMRYDARSDIENQR